MPMRNSSLFDRRKCYFGIFSTFLLSAGPIPKVSTGMGLQNIINRYALLTGRRVWAGDTQDAFVVKVLLL